MPAAWAARSKSAISRAARALGWFAANLSIRSWSWNGFSNSTPGRERAKDWSVFRTEWTFSRVTDVGAAQPCPTRRPEWTAKKTTSETEEELRAIANVSFLWRVTGRNSIISTRIEARTYEVHMKLPDSFSNSARSVDRNGH